MTNAPSARSFCHALAEKRGKHSHLALSLGFLLYVSSRWYFLASVAEKRGRNKRSLEQRTEENRTKRTKSGAKLRYRKRNTYVQSSSKNRILWPRWPLNAV